MTIIHVRCNEKTTIVVKPTFDFHGFSPKEKKAERNKEGETKEKENRKERVKVQ